MATDTQSGNGTSAIGPGTCPSIEDQLAKVTNDIITFEARKLPEMKAELEAVKKKKETAIPEYKSKFEGLKKLWCEQNDHILSMRRDLAGAFPDWKEYVKACICSALADKRKQCNRVECRSEVKGTREVARDQAKTELDAAKAVATAWESAAKTLEANLAENAKAIAELCKLTCSPDRAIAIYRLWFKLLPAHACIAPETDCFTVPVDEMTCELCPPDKPADDCRPCAQYEEEPAKPATDDDAKQETPLPPRWPHCKPWLIPPDQYAGVLDCAYDAYLAAKEAYAAAEAWYRKKPDDLAQVKKDLETLAKGLDAKIEECLKGKNPKGCCEDEDTKKQPDCNDPCAGQRKGA